MEYQYGVIWVIRGMDKLELRQRLNLLIPYWKIELYHNIIIYNLTSAVTVIGNNFIAGGTDKIYDGTSTATM